MSRASAPPATEAEGELSAAVVTLPNREPPWVIRGLAGAVFVVGALIIAIFAMFAITFTVWPIAAAVIWGAVCAYGAHRKINARSDAQIRAVAILEGAPAQSDRASSAQSGAALVMTYLIAKGVSPFYLHRIRRAELDDLERRYSCRLPRVVIVNSVSTLALIRSRVVGNGKLASRPASGRVRASRHGGKVMVIGAGVGLLIVPVLIWLQHAQGLSTGAVKIGLLAVAVVAALLWELLVGRAGWWIETGADHAALVRQNWLGTETSRTALPWSDTFVFIRSNRLNVMASNHEPEKLLWRFLPPVDGAQIGNAPFEAVDIDVAESPWRSVVEAATRSPHSPDGFERIPG